MLLPDERGRAEKSAAATEPAGTTANLPGHSAGGYAAAGEVVIDGPGRRAGAWRRWWCRWSWVHG
ncbi:hypothetical protein I6A60_34420 [Frankia sp. AgB1.9]|uniref:hypothetical protein n=1 Tax=Frankia sp. AgB1.8 TaxID=2792839 RepID=UPI0019336C64|nr:hypothetical protein [Frankia sp. AgB1.8]MBL7552910.1 hypothetical protein [Frankia sp. AgB1.9]